MRLPDCRDWLFSLKTYAAAMLAVYIGLLTSLPRPYWAMGTVFICSHPLSGATRSKSAFRVLGTLMGAAAAVVLVPNLATEPMLLSAGLALWIGACLFLSLLDRSPRSYAFMLGGYTAALIGFPAVADPAAIWDLALARSEEIVLGIACASFVSEVIVPRKVSDVVAARLNGWLADGARLARDTLAGTGAEGVAWRGLMRLAGDAVEIDVLSTHLAYERFGTRAVATQVEALRLRMILLLPVLSSVADRLAALRGVEGGLTLPLGDLIERLHAWIRPQAPAGDAAERERDAAEAAALRDAIAAATPPLDRQAGWSSLLTTSLALRLTEFVDIVEDCRALRRGIASNRRTNEPLRVVSAASIAAIRHRDRTMALLSALGVVCVTLLCCAFWIASGWTDGAAAPMMAAVAACFFASQDDPVPAMLQFANWAVVAVVAVGVELFVILPHAQDFETLALALAPLFLVAGVMMSMPRTMGRGLSLAANGSAALALQASYGADFPSYVNGNLALLGGMYGATVVIGIIRSVGAEWALRRIIWAGRRSISLAAARPAAADRARFTGLMLDRVGLIAPHLALLDADHALQSRDALAHIRTGLNVLDLQRVRGALPAAATAPVAAVLEGLAHGYRATLHIAPEDLLPAVDHALVTLMAADAAPGPGQDAAMALVGIRRGLFPAAAPFRPSGSIPSEGIAA